MTSSTITGFERIRTETKCSDNDSESEGDGSGGNSGHNGDDNRFLLPKSDSKHEDKDGDPDDGAEGKSQDN